MRGGYKSVRDEFRDTVRDTVRVRVEVGVRVRVRRVSLEIRLGIERRHG